MPNAASTPDWLVSALVVAAYLLGSISPGWWLARRAGVDLREKGSGVTGASNAGRVLGTKGYVAVLVLDVAKAMAAVYAARWLAPEAPWGLLVVPAVVAGHIWPVWLGFKGGRGAAPLLGAFLAINLWIVLYAWIPGALAWAIVRKGFAAKAAAFAASLPIGWWLVPTMQGRTALVLAWLLVLLAHRQYFGKTLTR